MLLTNKKYGSSFSDGKNPTRRAIAGWRFVPDAELPSKKFKNQISKCKMKKKKYKKNLSRRFLHLTLSFWSLHFEFWFHFLPHWRQMRCGVFGPAQCAHTKIRCFLSARCERRLPTLPLLWCFTGTPPINSAYGIAQIANRSKAACTQFAISALLRAY